MSEGEALEALEALEVGYYLVKIKREFEGVVYACHDSPAIYGRECCFFTERKDAILDFIKNTIKEQ